MSQNELLLQIELIESTLKSAERIAFPKKVLGTYGTLILLIPFIEMILPPTWLAHALTYAILFAGARKILVRYFNVWSAVPAHPIVAASLRALHRFTLCSALLISYALIQIGRMDLAFPTLIVHVAFLFFSFGKYSSNLLRLASYLQLILATAFILLLKDHVWTELFPYFTTLLGGTFWLGVFASES